MGYVDSFLERDVVPTPEDDGPQAPSKRPTGQGDRVLHKWTKEIDVFLRLLITLEGRGTNPEVHCRRCGSDRKAEFRCMECDNLGLLCQDCIVHVHGALPLHRLQKWNGGHFVKITLKSLGLRIQLGHPPGEKCPLPQQAWGDDFVIIDCDSVHTLGVDYCTCGATSKSEVEQLLERRLYPATTEKPKTAATFRVLEVFELLQYESKISPFELWKALARLTDNTGLNVVKDRYPSFLRMVHEWRHLKLLKRAGRGHDPDRTAAETKEGECALLCPSCPHPGINMPDGWENEPEETRYIHGLNLALDACFRMKRESVSSDEADPGLSQGFSYFVEQSKFNEYLDKHKDEVEPKSSCSRHDAVNLQDVSPGQGYSSTGVATVECSRHNMKRPSAVCDLQKGERYCNMDYIAHWGVVIFALTFLKTFFISYDIACQWSINFFKRLKEMNVDSPFLTPGTDVRFLVPKFHLPAHIPACQTKFAFMFTWGCGLCDGEAPERGWVESGLLAPCTRKMGPGSRRDTLDFNWGDYNWRKIVDLGPSLLKKLETAAYGVPEHVIAHVETEAGIDDEKLAEWTAAMVAWEKDPSLPSPFKLMVDAPKQAAIRKLLADEEAVALANKTDFAISTEVSPSGLISRGIDLEAEQRSLKADMRKTWTHSGDRELTRLQLRSNALVRKIEAWYTVLQLYIPSSFRLREEARGTETIPPYELPLWLPSEIGTKAPVDRRLIDIEYKLRFAQANESLVNLRRQLQRRVTMWDLKKRWVRGQGANTRALKTLGSIEERISVAKEEYRRSRVAVLALARLLGIKGLEKSFLPLLEADVRSLARPQAEKKLGETSGQTREVVSWIWRHSSTVNDNHTEFEAETVKVEWAKSRARAARYREEILIVREEMNRTLRFLAWKACQWRARAVAKQAKCTLSPEYAEGLQAYGLRQAAICEGQARLFTHLWSGVDKMIADAMAECADPELFAQRKKEREEAERKRRRKKRAQDPELDDEHDEADEGETLSS